MNVFISYGALEDRVTALRLQALAAVNGMCCYVPPASSRRSLEYANQTRKALAEADIVFAIDINGEFDKTALWERSDARDSGKAIWDISSLASNWSELAELHACAICGDPGPEIYPAFCLAMTAVGLVMLARRSREEKIEARS